MPRPEPLPTGRVTFLFTDIEGSTRLSQLLGERFAAVIDRHHEIMRSAFAMCGGVVISTEGDSFFAVFVDVGDALIGTVAAQRALATETWPDGVSIRVRMGLHTGDGRLGGDNYAGIDVIRASRISNAAHGGQVLLSRASANDAADSLPRGVRLQDLGEILLKDIPAPEPVLQLVIDGLESGFPPLRAERPGWLPEPLTSFLGRESELAAIARHLDEHRLVTLTGPGGTGKTRLSIEAARSLQPGFPGGTWFVPVEAIEDHRLVMPEIADRLGVSSDDGRSISSALAEHVGAKRTLLVLDNLEQVVSVGPELHELLSGATGLHVLASSREALRISGEQEYPVPVLDIELGVRLFVDRARNVRPDLRTNPEMEEDIRAIVARLDALPLAIELAAARVRMFQPDKLRQRLESGLGELGAGNQELPQRQRTIRGAVEWSYRLLDERDRRVFERLAVFRGGAELESAEAVIGATGVDQGDVLDAVASLADKSLLSIGEQPDGEPRLRMLELIRTYAAERLSEDPDVAIVERCHAEHYLGFAETMEAALRGAVPAEALPRTELDHDNLRAALDWSLRADRPAVGLRIGGAIWRFWQQRAHLVEGRERLEALIAHPAAEDDPCALARGATGLGGLAYWQSDQRDARAAYEIALDRYRRCGDRPGEAQALFDLAYPVAILGDVDAAAALTEQSLAIYTELDDRNGIALVMESSATFAIISGDYRRAREMQEPVADIARACATSAPARRVAASEGAPASCLARMASVGRRSRTSRRAPVLPPKRSFRCSGARAASWLPSLKTSRNQPACPSALKRSWPSRIRTCSFGCSSRGSACSSNKGRQSSLRCSAR